MSRHYPIEALLRPPVELWSVVVATCAMVITLSAPQMVLMPAVIAQGAACLFGVLAWYRLRQAWQVIRYQRNLRRLRNYTLRADRIPVTRQKLFLGLGFRWTQQHTQRLRDTQRPEVQRYWEMGLFYRWARRKEIDWESTFLLRYVAWFLGQRAWWNPLSPLPPVGGNPRLHGVELKEHPVWMPLGDRVGHTLVLGTTRVGKTRLAEILITQDIHRGEVVIVFDPKGDAELLKRVYAEARRAKRQHQFYLFHLGFPEHSARYNAVGNFSRVTEVATRIANQLPNEGNSAAFKEFAWRFTNIIARALVALGQRPDYRQIARHITHMDHLFVEYSRQWLAKAASPDWENEVAERAQRLHERDMPVAMKGRTKEVVALVQYIRDHQLYDVVADGLLSAVTYDKTYFDKIVASVLPLLEKLTTGRTAELIAPNYFDTNDSRPIFDWMQVIRSKGIVYVGLDALSDQTVASAVGNSMFADLVSVAGRLYKHGISEGLPGLRKRGVELPKLCLHADEFNELIGDEFVPLLNKAGGAGFQVTAYTQTWSDVEARIGNRAKAGQVAGNFNTLIMLRVKELATAEMLTNQLNPVEITSLTQVSGVSDSAEPLSPVDFTSRNEDRISVTEVPMITPGDIVVLPKGQAFALLEGGQLWKIRMPLPDTRHDRWLPKDLYEIARDLQTRRRHH